MHWYQILHKIRLVYDISLESKLIVHAHNLKLEKLKSLYRYKFHDESTLQVNKS